MKKCEKTKRPFHVMIIPALGCPPNAATAGPEVGSPRMTTRSGKIVEWLRDLGMIQTFTFHGGEPLLAGADYYRAALPCLKESLSISANSPCRRTPGS